MKKFLLSLALPCLAFLISGGCVFVQSSAITGTTHAATSGQVIQETANDYGFLHLSAPNGLTQVANQGLLSKCTSGKISNVQTQLSVRDWFYIVQYYEIDTTAVCE